MDERRYSWRHVVEILENGRFGQTGPPRLEALKAEVAAGNVYVDYPDLTGEWLLKLEPDETIRWMCVYPPRRPL